MKTNTKILLSLLISVTLIIGFYKVLDAKIDFLMKWNMIKAIRSNYIEYQLNKLEHGVHDGSN